MKIAFNRRALDTQKYGKLADTFANRAAGSGEK